MDRIRKIDIFNVVYAWIFVVLCTVISFRDGLSGIMNLSAWLIVLIIYVVIYTFCIFNPKKYKEHTEERSKTEAYAKKRLGRFYLPYRIISLVFLYSIPVWVLWRPIVDIKISIAIFICLLVWLVVVHVAERRPKKDADITAK